jgi:hypothetical protein
MRLHARRIAVFMARCCRIIRPMIGHIDAVLAAKLATKPDKMVEYDLAAFRTNTALLPEQ